MAKRRAFEDLPKKQQEKYLNKINKKKYLSKYIHCIENSNKALREEVAALGKLFEQPLSETDIAVLKEISDERKHALKEGQERYTSCVVLYQKMR